MLKCELFEQLYEYSLNIGILRIIGEDEDSVIIYKFPLDFMPKREILGLEKNPIDDII